MSAIVVLVLDVGSLVNIGWWRSLGDECGRGGRDLDDFVSAVVADLDAGRRVALGFESPLFIPCPDSSAPLTPLTRATVVKEPLVTAVNADSPRFS